MIDLRPLMDEIPLEVVSNVVNDVTAVELPSHPLPSQPEVRRAGMADQLPEDRALDEAANRSIAEAEVQNWFVKEREQFFTFNYYWDSPKEMQEYVEAEWSHSITIDEEAYEILKSHKFGRESFTEVIKKEMALAAYKDQMESLAKEFGLKLKRKRKHALPG